MLLSRRGLEWRILDIHRLDSACMAYLFQLLVATTHLDLPPSPIMISATAKTPGSTDSLVHPSSNRDSSIRRREASVLGQRSTRSRRGWLGDRAGRRWGTAGRRRRPRWTSYSTVRGRTAGSPSTVQRRGRWSTLEAERSRAGLSNISIWRHLADLRRTPTDNSRHLRALRYSRFEFRGPLEIKTWLHHLHVYLTGSAEKPRWGYPLPEITSP